jgi:hypothetical protein
MAVALDQFIFPDQSYPFGSEMSSSYSPPPVYATAPPSSYTSEIDNLTMPSATMKSRAVAAPTSNTLAQAAATGVVKPKQSKSRNGT